MKIYLAMSGGIDSSVCLYLLQQQYKEAEIIGITLKLTDNYLEEEGYCIWRARKICEKFGIKHITLDYRKDFKKEIIDKFNEEIKLGITPVPCVDCNKNIKFGNLLDFCIKNNGKLATGHYAKIIYNKINNEIEIYKAKDLLKDQTHFLNQIKKQSLNYIMFPLGDYLKSEVYRIAKREKLLNIDNYKESQDVCFFNNQTYCEYIKKVIDKKESSGEIKHIITNKTIGTHSGLLKYTIGQRQGLGISWCEPLYVVKKDINNNILFVGEENTLYSNEFQIADINIISNEINDKDFFECQVCLRDKTPIIEAKIIFIDDNKKKAKVFLKQQARAITIGQSCVFYNKNKLLGGGKIINC